MNTHFVTAFEVENTSEPSVNEIKKNSSISNTVWNDTFKAYLNPDTCSIWIFNESDSASLSHNFCEDQDSQVDILDSEPECPCDIRSLHEELAELATRLNEGSLGDLDPYEVSPSALFYAGLRYGFRRFNWHKIASNPNSRMERLDATVVFSAACGKGHRENLIWTQESGWHFERNQISSKKSERNLDPSLIVKEIYDSRCQFCSGVLESPKGRIAEAAHIWEVKDGGPDSVENLLCLCPNCHSQFDAGTWALHQIDDHLVSIDVLTREIRKFNKDDRHQINFRNVRYRNSCRKKRSPRKDSFSYSTERNN